MEGLARMPSMPQRPRVLLFDVNETLLDTAPLKQKIRHLLQDATGGNLRFTTMLHW